MKKSTFTATSDNINTTNFPKKEEKTELVAIWEKKDKYGRTYLSLRIKIDGKEYNCTAFENKNKKQGDNTPDYIAYKREK